MANTLEKALDKVQAMWKTKDVAWDYSVEFNTEGEEISLSILVVVNNGPQFCIYQLHQKRDKKIKNIKRELIAEATAGLVSLGIHKIYQSEVMHHRNTEMGAHIEVANSPLSPEEVNNK